MFPSPCGVWVVSAHLAEIDKKLGFPSPCGVWVVSKNPKMTIVTESVSVPLRGVGCFRKVGKTCRGVWFPSPCGVWVVSANLHILFDTAGKRIVNSAVLLYHIDRWFINSKLRETRSAVRSV